MMRRQVTTNCGGVCFEAAAAAAAAAAATAAAATVSANYLRCQWFGSGLSEIITTVTF